MRSNIDKFSIMLSSLMMYCTIAICFCLNNWHIVVYVLVFYFQQRFIKVSQKVIYFRLNSLRK